MRKIFNFQFSIFNSHSGFTLIELLVVLVIVSVLAGLAVSGYSGIRQRTRDSQRKGDLVQIQAALEQYRTDQGAYPTAIPTSGCGTSIAKSGCSTTYLRKVPSDPSGSGYYNSGTYYFSSDGVTYSLVGCLENASDKSGVTTPPSGAPTTNCTSGKYYVLQNQ